MARYSKSNLVEDLITAMYLQQPQKRKLLLLSMTS